MEIHPDDILTALIYLASFDKFIYGSWAWAEFLYGHEKDFPGLRRMFRLRKKGNRVRSLGSGIETPLDQSYASLIYSELISHNGLTERHKPGKKLKSYYEKYASRRLSQEDKSKLQEIAQELKRKFAV